MNLPRYALITPARNEARFIEATIRAMQLQTVPPQRWVIVSDGSSDGTDEIVQRHLPGTPWLRLVRRDEREDRSFAAKARAFKAGYAALGDVDYDVIGNLDADITVEADHFAYLLAQFAHDPRLGVAGTPFVEGRRQYDYRFTNIEHVSGACQMFRRACFEQLGGYQEARVGIDWIAVTTARMQGWRTRTFTERTCRHHRPIGSAAGLGLGPRFRQGRKDRALGGHALWQLFRAAYQMASPPLVLGGLALLAGFAWGGLRRDPITVSPALMAFHRAEQMARLRQRLPWLRRLRAPRLDERPLR
jgi:hypothetical protein